MQVDAILKRCNEFICKYLPTNPSSPLMEYIYTYEMGISPEKIFLKVKSHLESVFTETLEKYVFLQTSFEQLLTIISNRELNARDEYVIVKCVVMWVIYDVEHRLPHANALLQHVDCSLCSKSMMLENKFINTNVPLLDKLLQQLHIKISILNDSCTKGLIKQYGVERINAIEVPRVVPGAITYRCNSLYNVSEDGIYNTVTKESLVPGTIKSSSKSLYHVSEDDIYNTATKERLVPGAIKSLCHVSKDGIYKTATKERLVQYNFGEVDNVIYTTKGLLFIFSFSGGKMYKYNIATKEVDVCSYPTNYYFSYSSSVNETSNGRLVVIGGWGSNGNWSNEMKYYDIANDSWCKGQSLPYCVDRHAAVVDGDDIYVIGGDEDNKVIRYRNGVWQTLSPLLNDRHWHIAVLDDNCIYVYGGNRTDCECYTILTNRWSVVDNAVYTNIQFVNSVIDIKKRLLYTHDDVNVFYISLDNGTKSLLSESVYYHRLVLMHV